VHQDLDDLKVAATRQIHVALQGSDNASILNAAIRCSGGHLVQPSALVIFPRVQANLRDLVIVSSEAVSVFKQMYNGVYW